MSVAAAILAAMEITTVLVFIVALAAGMAIGYLFAKSRSPKPGDAVIDTTQIAEIASLNATVQGKNELIAKLDSEVTSLRSRNDEEKALVEKFEPLAREMEALKLQVKNKETADGEAFTAIKTQIESSQSAERELRNQTTALANALAKPGGKGSWGELTLERLVESLGLVQNVDWLKKEKLEAETDDEEVKRRYPDLVIRMPKNRYVAVDSKVPYTNYLAAMDAEDEVKNGDFSKRDDLLKKYVSDIRTQIDKLAEKNYYNGLPNSPEFTVLYMPNEPALSVALRVDPALMEYAFGVKIVLVTPSSFYTVLKTVAHIWSRSEDEKTLNSAIGLAQKFMQQVRLLAKDVSSLKTGLQGAADSYNAMTKRLNKQFIDATMKLADAPLLAQSAADMAAPGEIDTQLNDLTSIEFKGDEPDELS
jgi:DNA recombination protein RmuC